MESTIARTRPAKRKFGESSNVTKHWLSYAKVCGKDEPDVSVEEREAKDPEMEIDLPVINPTETSTTTPTLLRLPAEIRAHILTYAMTVHNGGDCPMSFSPERSRKYSRLRVLQVCRQLNREAAPIFYGVNRLFLASPTKLYHFLVSLTRTKRNMIRRLSVSGWWGLHPQGWQLCRRAFSMLHLCHGLREFHLTLHTDIDPDSFEIDPLWPLAFGDANSVGDQVVDFSPGFETQCRETEAGAKALSQLRGLEIVSLRYRFEDCRPTKFLYPAEILVDTIPGAEDWAEKFLEDCRKPRSGAVATHMRRTG